MSNNYSIFIFNEQIIMGIHNLLAFLKPVIKKGSVKQFRGKTCVIDIMSWMYRGAFSCAAGPSDCSKENTLSYMGYPLKMLSLLISWGIKPLCVFDGRPHEGKL